MTELEVTCSKCKESKSRSLFGVDKSTPTGICYQCKACRYNYRCKNKERARRSSKDHYRENKEDKLKKVKEYRKTPKGIITRNKAYKKWVEKNPKKYAARNAVGVAKAKGDLIAGDCEVCGDTKTQAHHCDYDKQLEVTWLCDHHHKKWHKLNGEGKNG